MNLKNWGVKMKWEIFRDDSKWTTKDNRYEYQYWKFISEDLEWVFPLYARQGTELHEILKYFTEDDISDLGDYLWSKDYPIEKYDSYNENLKSSRQFSQKVLSDFVYGDRSYIPKENNKDTIYTINNNWNKGNVRLSISKNNVETTVDAFSHDLDENVSGRVLLENLLFATGGNLGKYNYVTVKGLTKNYSMLENNIEELIEKWDKDESVEVVSISKTTNDYLNIDQFIVTLHDTDSNYKFENYIIEGKR